MKSILMGLNFCWNGRTFSLPFYNKQPLRYNKDSPKNQMKNIAVIIAGCFGLAAVGYTIYKGGLAAVGDAAKSADTMLLSNS